ncbi:MAG TPA: ATP-binding protein [Thermodesulfobacteriota bacterium]|nr:GAF domain-containing protein [Deltaproteobacteria bacterium]HNR13439.1 ATP-binding protein [Thermodesulfobacteriota bacterium]HNU72293.1 ATP-binding protein [Thermodesulfobacteriota bacterium]
MSSLTKPELEKALRRCEAQVAALQKGNSAVLELSDTMEDLTRFQDKIDIPSGNIDRIWDVFLGYMRRLIHVEVCSLFLVDDVTREFILKHAAPEDQAAFCQEEVAYQIECGMFSWVVQRRKPAVVPSLVFKDQKTIIMLPLCTVRKTYGMAVILSPIEESSITQENLRLLTMLSRQCSLVIENTMLYDRLRTQHDSLQKAQVQILQAEKLASIGRLTAGVSHEILNPLNIISGYVQLLLRDDTLSERLARFLSIMKGQCDRIARVVTGLLEFSRLPKQSRRNLNVCEVIEKVFALVEYEIRFDNIRVVKKLDHVLPDITGDEERLSHVFFNLFHNAWDSMPHGGTLTVDATIVGDPTGQASRDWIAVTVSDTGCGIPEEHLRKVFDPFFTTRSDGGRSGLGLSLSYGIIQEHGGKIDINSTVNQGTTVRVYLPGSVEPEE